MAEWTNFWRDASLARKLSLLLGLLLILALLLGVWRWVHRPLTGVLFADLAARDAAVIVAELDKSKQPYELSDDGRTIYVASEAVHKTRLNLMGHSLPLHGVVGFEVFNNADFGASDFVQRVNYLRALQGELTRTILSLEQVQDARVHLALPEQTLFKKDSPKAKASVTLTLKPGERLGAAQVQGIQRLVAASVAEVQSENVAVLDQHGVTLSHAAGEESQQAITQLDAKQAAEAALGGKAQALLTQLYGSGEALVAVDVVLNHAQSRVTLEEILPSGSTEQGARGVITRERSSSRESSAQGSATPAQDGVQQSNQEIEYRVGRRTEQTASNGGQVAHINVAVVVKRALSEAEQQHLRQLLAAAVGLQPQRGDSLAIHALGSGLNAAAASETAAPAAIAAIAAAPAASLPTAARSAAQPFALASYALALGIPMLALVALLLWQWRRPRALAGTPLSDSEREALLRQLQQWLSAPTRQG